MTSAHSTVDGGVTATKSGLRHTATHIHTYEWERELYAIRAGAEVEVGVMHVGHSKLFLSLTAAQAREFAQRLTALAADLDRDEGDA